MRKIWFWFLKFGITCWCVVKNHYHLLVVGCETSKSKEILIYMHLLLETVYIQKNIRHFQYFKGILELQRIVLCYEIHLPCNTTQPIGILWNTCFHKNVHNAYYQEWQIKTILRLSNIKLYKFCSISTKLQLMCFICFIYLSDILWSIHQDNF